LAVLSYLVIGGWPDLNALSVRLVIATAVLFGFPTAVGALHLGRASLADDACRVVGSYGRLAQWQRQYLRRSLRYQA
jgi:hypothetical protein